MSLNAEQAVLSKIARLRHGGVPRVLDLFAGCGGLSLGFKAAAVRPCFWNGRYPTLPEFDPLWREFEASGVVLAMHTFPSREALTPEWGQRMAQARGHSGQGLLFTDESVVYSLSRMSQVWARR